MAFDFGKWLPYLISGGASVAGAVIGSRAAGKAGEQSAAAAELASETQLQMSREQIANLRQIYGMDLSLNWPRHRVATESLGNLARGMGSKLPPSTFETSEAPPELPGFGAGPPGGAPEAPPGDPLNPNAQAPIMTPPPGTGPAGTGSRTASGAATGAAIGSVVPGVGTAVGAGVGALGGWLSGVFGGDQRIADHIVPSQNDLTSRIGEVGGELSRRINDGTATEQDWQNAIQIVENMRSQFYGFADETAGGDATGARQTIDAWVNPMLDAWGKRATNWSDDWSTWQFDPNSVWSPPPSPTPSRQFGGPVGGTLSSMGRKRPEYLVGEVGEEMYVDEQGNSSMVGVGGPQMFQPPRDGYIVPNHELGQQGGAFTLSNLGDGTYGMPPPRMSGMRGRYMGSRRTGGRVKSVNWDDNDRWVEAIKQVRREAGGVTNWKEEREKAKKIYDAQKAPVATRNHNPVAPDVDTLPPAPETLYQRTGIGRVKKIDAPVAKRNRRAGPPDVGDLPPGRSPADPVPPPAGRAPASGPALSPGNAAELRGWGWTLRPDGTWYHAETGNVGTVRDGSTLVDNQNNASFNFDHYRANPDSYTPGVAVHDAAGITIPKAPDPPATPPATPPETPPATAPKPPSSITPPGHEFIWDGQQWVLRPIGSTPPAVTPPAVTPPADPAAAPVLSPNNAAELRGWGWTLRPDGTWYHAETGNVGTVRDGSTLVDNQNNASFNFDHYRANPDSYTPGVAVHDAAGEVIAPAPPPAPNSDNSRSPSGPIAEREFIDPDPNRGNYSPPSSATHPAPDPFSWQARGDMPGPAPGMIKELNSWGWYEQGDGTWRHKDGDTAHFVNDTTMVSTTGDKTFHVDRYLAGRDDHTEEGISDLHRQFDPSEYGYMPLNEQFEFDPSEAGYMPFNEQFEFDTEDLLKDPGYQWRLNEGSKAVERKGAARGMLQSGRTLKSLSSWAQGLASQEYGAAYGRARGEHQMDYGKSADAYNRELGEFGMRRGQSLGAYDQALQRWGMKYGMYGDEYNRASGEYERERDEWRWDDQRRYGRTRDLAGI